MQRISGGAPPDLVVVKEVASLAVQLPESTTSLGRMKLGHAKRKDFLEVSCLHLAKRESDNIASFCFFFFFSKYVRILSQL